MRVRVKHCTVLAVLAADRGVDGLKTHYGGSIPPCRICTEEGETTMMMGWSDDPERDASRYAADLEEEGARRPRCCECDSPIWDDEYYQIDGQDAHQQATFPWRSGDRAKYRHR